MPQQQQQQQPQQQPQQQQQLQQQQQGVGMGLPSFTQHGTTMAAAALPLPLLAPHMVPSQPRQQEQQQQAILPVLPPNAMPRPAWQPSPPPLLQQPATAPLQQAGPHCVALPNLPSHQGQ